MRIAVVGAGAWGTTLASLVTPRAEVVLWAREPEVVEGVNEEHANPLFLPGFRLSPAVRATTDLEEAVAGAEVVVLGVPAQWLRAVLGEAAPLLHPGTPLVSIAKGIEQGTRLRMTQVIAEVLPDHDRDRIGVLTGPNLAREVMAGQPTATVVALRDEIWARAIQSLFMSPTLRVYTNRDVVGCESAGALKNVIALAAGMAHGLGYGDNSKAALITRGLAELTRLGVALGGEPLTFLGLAGNGDLIATCSSPQSRNRTVGEQLGKGRPLADVLAGMRSVAEGVRSAPAVLALADELGVEMPIATHVQEVLADGRNPADVVADLMGRAPRDELHGIHQPVA